MNYSPKLKRVMAEIEAILKKEDIAGLVVLHTQQHGSYYSEFLFELTPSLSAVKLENNYLQIKAKGTDIRLPYTSNMLRLLAETSGRCSINLFELSEKVDEIIGAEHGDITHRPGNYSDN